MSDIGDFLGKAIRFARTGGLRAKVGRLRNRLDLRHKIPRLDSYPSTLYLEPGTLCNLKCPFCPTGNGNLRIKRELLDPETFEKIASHLPLAHLTHAFLYNWGEPFLNPHLMDYIRFLSTRGIICSISTNLSVKEYDEDFFQRLVRSGLRELAVSVDGATQEVYEKYRVRGNLARIVANMRGVAKAKAELGSKFPRVEMRMLLNRFNEPQIEDARRLAEGAGAEFRVNRGFHIPARLREEWIADSNKRDFGAISPTIYGTRRSGVIHTECRQMWDTIVVNCNGDVYPCCIVSDAASAVGNLVEQEFDDVWNGEKMMALRRYAVDPSAAPPGFPNSCEKCTNRYCTHPG